MKELKVVFMGTPDFSVKPLEALIENTNVVGIVTQPDKEFGRKKEIKFSPVKEIALKNNIKLFQPNKIKNEYKEMLELNPDVIITCAYGQIVPKEVLEYPKYKCINIHASLLPKLRGGAPIHKAIINGYTKTGVTIMYMDEKMDSGDILYQKEIEILEDDNVGTLFDKLSLLGSKMIIEFLPKLISGDFNPIKQDVNEITYAYNITKEEEKINFDMTSREVFNHIRGLNPWPVGYAILDDKKVKLYESKIGSSTKTGIPGEIINVYKDSIGIKTIDGEILITELQVEGKKKMNVNTYLNGLHENIIGKKFN